MRRRNRRRNDPVQQQTRPHAVVPHAGVAKQRGAVRRVDVRSRRAAEIRALRAAVDFDVASALLESNALLFEQRAVGIVGGREMRVDRGELEIRALEQLRKRAPQVVEPETEPVHAGVDLQVIRQRSP